MSAAGSRRAYGEHPDQWIAARLPARPRPGAQPVVLLHGGYWRRRHTAELMAPLAEDLLGRGWPVVLVEYRRGPGAWPELAADLPAALSAARAATGAAALTLIGHSVGGQLALLGAAPGDAVVALAPVTDPAAAHRAGHGEGAADEFFGGPPELFAGDYAAATPPSRLPAGVRLLLVHGPDDDRVPIAHSRRYVAAVDRAGGAVRLIEQPGLGHVAAIDPAGPHWPAVLRWLAALDGPPPAR